MKKIYVGNLPYRAKREEVEQFFSECGTVINVALIRDRHTKRPKGFGFVEFETEEVAQKSLSMDGKEFQGRPLKVSIAKERVEEPQQHEQ